MIRNKLEVGSIIRSLNELEKLKLLLFDEDQYYLFEHIPKPYLIDSAILKDEQTIDQNKGDEELGKKKKKKKKGKKGKKKIHKTKNQIIMSSQSFWKKRLDHGMDNFAQAFDNIKRKGKDMNIIDKRLLNIITNLC
jgi:hypothetical protein